MPVISIDGIKVDINETCTILEAAQKVGIYIPTLCFAKRFHSVSSCMVCAVIDRSSGKTLASCSTLIQDGMDIVSQNEDLTNFRRVAVELLLSEHVGDCEAPCQRVCPAHLNIPAMNHYIAHKNFEKAIQIIYETIPLPAILGLICTAPCEKVCRRRALDNPVSICVLKRTLGLNFIENKLSVPIKKQAVEKKIAVIGSGPAGLSASYFLKFSGYNVDIIEKNQIAGGNLRANSIIGKIYPEIIDNEISKILSLGINVQYNFDVNINNVIVLAKKYDYLIFTVYPDFISGLENICFIAEIGNWESYTFSGCSIFIRKKNTFNKMAVQSVFHGRFVSECVNQHNNGQKITGIVQKFNSSYSNFTKEEAENFCKENINNPRNELGNCLSFDSNQSVSEAKRCLHCECLKANNCKLRSISEYCDAKQSRFRFPERKKIEKVFYSNVLAFEYLKCIKCGICVQISEQYKAKGGFTFLGRGFDLKIGFPIGFSIDDAIGEFVNEAIQNCPTGALSCPQNNSKPYIS